MSPDELAALCAAALPGEALSADDLRTTCFENGAETIGDAHGAAAYVLKEFPDLGLTVAWLLLVAVAPTRRRRGLGRALVAAVVERCRSAGARELHTGNCAPRYLWPGVDLSNTQALAFFQALGFEAYDHGLNMLLPTSFRATVPTGVTIERETADGCTGLARREFPNWEDEITRGVEKGTAFAARDREGATIAFAAHSVNRRTWIGPMGTDPARRLAGTGHALLGALAQDISAATGADHAEIAWVGPVPFYAKAGAVAYRSFRMHRLGLS